MVRNFAVYYGPAVPDFPAGYDLAVLEPGAWGVAPLALKAHGTALLAYLSVLEVPLLSNSVLRRHGVPQRNRTWGNWILDPRHPETAHRLLDAAGALRRAGWDGLFLDTLGDVEAPGADEELLPAAARLVAALADAWPGGALVQNWGLSLLLPLTAPFLRGVCWEGFPHSHLAAGDPGSTLLARSLKSWAGRGLQVLTLNEDEDGGDGGAVAAPWGFPWYGAPGAYTRLPPPVTTPRRAATCETAGP